MPTSQESATAEKGKGRFVVSLPAEVGEQIDAVGRKIGENMHAQTGATFEPTRAQIVQALVRSALDHGRDKPAA